MQRLSSSYKISHVCVNNAEYPSKINDKLIMQCKEKEGESLLKRIDSLDFVIALNLNRKEMDSVEFSSFITNLLENGIGSLVFVIGGSYGLGENLLGRANFELTLSKMTLLHEMSIVFILEQIYRAVNIVNKTPYHK